MITFTTEQIKSMTPEERQILDNLVERHHATVESDEQTEYQKKIRQHIKEHFDLEKENEEYRKLLQSQFDTNGGGVVRNPY